MGAPQSRKWGEDQKLSTAHSQRDFWQITLAFLLALSVITGALIETLKAGRAAWVSWGVETNKTGDMGVSWNGGTLPQNTRENLTKMDDLRVAILGFFTISLVNDGHLSD